MKSITGRVFAGALLLGSAAFAQEAPNQYLDVLYLHVKPGKGSEFQAIARKIADANRRYKGSDWIAYAGAFGEGGTYVMVSSRKDFAAIDLASQMFMRAMGEALTPSGAMKLLDDAGNLLTGTRTELHRRRMDLSFNAPTDQAEVSKLVGQSRWLRTMTVKVRPGRTTDMEEAIRTVKEAAEKNKWPATFVAQSALGTNGTEFYFRTFRDSLAGFDQDAASTLKEALGEEGYGKFETTIAEVAVGSSTALYRIAPELCNPPERVAAVDTAFWNPKPMAVTAGRRTKEKQPRTDNPQE